MARPGSGSAGELCPTCPELGSTCHGWHKMGAENWCPSKSLEDCADCMTPCCRHEAVRDRWLERIGSLEWSSWEPTDHGLELPGVIFRLHRKSWGVPAGAVTVSAEQILRPGGWTKSRNIRERFEVADGDLLGLDWSVKDEILDQLGTLDPGELADVVEACGFDFMFAPNFSAFLNHGSLSNAISYRRQALYAAAVAGRGVPVVADVGYTYPLDAYRGFRTYRGHKYGLKTFQKLYLQASSKLLQRHLADVRWFYRNGGWMPIFAGLHGQRARVFVEAFPRAVLWDVKLYRASEFRKDLAGKQVFGSRVEAWTENVTAYRRRVELWRRANVEGRQGQDPHERKEGQAQHEGAPGEGPEGEVRSG